MARDDTRSWAVATWTVPAVVGATPLLVFSVLSDPAAGALGLGLVVVLAVVAVLAGWRSLGGLLTGVLVGLGVLVVALGAVLVASLVSR